MSYSWSGKFLDNFPLSSDLEVHAVSFVWLFHLGVLCFPTCSWNRERMEELMGYCKAGLEVVCDTSIHIPLSRTQISSISRKEKTIVTVLVSILLKLSLSLI